MGANKELETETTLLKKVFLPLDNLLANTGFLLAILLPLLFFGYTAWLVFSGVQESSAVLNTPFLKATAKITSKDIDQHLSIKSADLPKGGDVIAVDQYVYGAVVAGDSVCVQYKQIQDDKQYGTEFVAKGTCLIN
jgi:hypothetical protein